VSELVRPSPRPSARQRVARRIEPVFIATTPARIATTAGALLLVAVAAWWLLRTPAPPVEQALPRASTVAATTGSARPTTSAGPDELVVQVAGAVVQPAVYRVADGSRVGDVVARAGGPTADADPTALNLAARVVDGERVYVPRIGEVVTVAPSGSQGTAQPTPAAPVDLNTATPDQLETLPGIGPATAQAIVDQRERNGPFQSVDDLLDVRGIGPAKLDAIRDLVRV
jgi:competence protein ComEA